MKHCFRSVAHKNIVCRCTISLVTQARCTRVSQTCVTAASSRTTTACRTFRSGTAHHAMSSNTPVTALSSLPWSSPTILSSSSESPCADLCPWSVKQCPLYDFIVQPRLHSYQLISKLCYCSPYVYLSPFI